MKLSPKKDFEKETGEGQNQAVKPATISAVRGLIEQAERSLRSAKSLLLGAALEDRVRRRSDATDPEGTDASEAGRIVEGVFDGCQMIGSDSRRYPVPPNYASKSKLVSGDLLKLTIAPDGAFIFKQIGPVERKKVIGVLEEEQGRYYVRAEDKRYQVLQASMTFYQAKPGDRLTIVLPLKTESDWAAVENLVG